jgi:plasmid stabilization system protein ParE
MSLPLIITEEAEEDLADAKAWYDRQRQGLGERFVLCVEAALDQIRRAPGAATEVYPGVRRVVVRQFPYGVFYRVDPDQIAVIAVYHSRRDPRGWQARA